MSLESVLKRVLCIAALVPCLAACTMPGQCSRGSCRVEPVAETDDAFTPDDLTAGLSR